MPWSVQIDYTCPVCKKQFQSTHYKPPERCPTCRKEHRAKRSLVNYHKRMEEHRAKNKHRDTAYDPGARLGAPASVYSSQCAIPLKREHAACVCCGNVTDIVNHFCAVCRANGANEWQCMNPGTI
jgi:predicted amidophosphoribosyltransferase